VIEDWGILNICTDDICDHCSKDGKRCDKSVKFICGDFRVCSGNKKLKKYSDKKFKCVPKKKNPMLDQGTKMVEMLSAKDIFLTVDLVVIENQPALKNPTMKSIQMMLYSFFIEHGYNSNQSTINNIILFSARDKLKLYNGPSVDTSKIKNQYNKRKYLSIEYTKYYIKDSEFYEYFINSNKKDDLADSYLQGLWYIRNKLLI
jgi:hypothetical protein